MVHVYLLTPGSRKYTKRRATAERDTPGPAGCVPAVNPRDTLRHVYSRARRMYGYANACKL